MFCMIIKELDRPSTMHPPPPPSASRSYMDGCQYGVLSTPCLHARLARRGSLKLSVSKRCHSLMTQHGALKAAQGNCLDLDRSRLGSERFLLYINDLLSSASSLPCSARNTNIPSHNRHVGQIYWSSWTFNSLSFTPPNTCAKVALTSAIAIIDNR